MQPFLEEKREQIAELCRTHHVRRLSVFGSATRDDFDPSRSDVDILVDFEPLEIDLYADNRWSLEDGLKALFGREVDLITEKYIRNPYLRQAIEEDRTLVYAA